MNKVDEIREALIWLVELRPKHLFEGDFSQFWKTFFCTTKLEKHRDNSLEMVAYSASECVGDFALSVEIDSALESFGKWRESVAESIEDYIQESGNISLPENLRDTFPKDVEQLELLMDRFRKIIRFLPDSRDPFERHCDRLAGMKHREIATRWKELNPADLRSIEQIKRASENYTRKKLSQSFDAPTKKPTRSKKLKNS